MCDGSDMLLGDWITWIDSGDTGRRLRTRDSNARCENKIIQFTVHKQHVKHSLELALRNKRGNRVGWTVCNDHASHNGRATATVRLESAKSAQ